MNIGRARAAYRRAVGARKASRIPRAFVMLADSLNEYAAQIEAGVDLPNHRPSSPAFWFDGLAREQAKAWLHPETAALLSEQAVKELRARGIKVAR